MKFHLKIQSDQAMKGLTGLPGLFLGGEGIKVTALKETLNYIQV